MISQKIDWQSKQNNQLTNINFIDWQLFSASNSRVKWSWVWCYVGNAEMQKFHLTRRIYDCLGLRLGLGHGPQVEQNN